MQQESSSTIGRMLTILAAFILAAAALPEEAASQSPPEWRSHDPARPHPPVVTPGAQVLPVPPPSDAVVLFDGTDLANWCGEEGSEATWVVEEGVMKPPGRGEDLYTVQTFGDVQLHIEWASPSPARGSGQGRGNSGVFFMGLYEVQILDSYENETYADGQAASIYGQYPPLVNACRPPGEWQSYDIVFRRPRFRADRSLAEPARFSVIHNGIVVQDAVALKGPTMWLQHLPYAFHPDRLPISIQDHGNPVLFRNIWLRELRESDEPGPAWRAPERVTSLSAADLEKYAGTFKYRPDSKSGFVVRSDGCQLHMLFDENRARVDLVPNSRTKFAMRRTAAHVDFALDEEGKATAMTLTVAGSSFTVKRVE